MVTEDAGEYKNVMRIVGGSLGGRVLRAPSGAATRPTSEKVREAIFNILPDVTGADVLDLFAGSGALGIEALSRGAHFALFVDDSAEARALLRGNVEAFGLGAQAQILRADASRLGPAPAGAPFTLAFLDPPYGKGLAGPALAALAAGEWLADGALCVVEEAAKAQIAAPPGFPGEDERTYGDTKITFLRRVGPANPA